jgi:hypothetical protein
MAFYCYDMYSLEGYYKLNNKLYSIIKYNNID